MSILKWSMESVIAAVAVTVTTAGGIYSTSYHWGVVNQKIEALQEKNVRTDNQVAKQDDQLDTIKQQNSAMQQSLSDIKDLVKDIQSQLKREQRGNN